MRGPEALLTIHRIREGMNESEQPSRLPSCGVRQRRPGLTGPVIASFAVVLCAVGMVTLKHTEHEFLGVASICVSFGVMFAAGWIVGES